MSNQITASINSLLNNAVKLSEKVENSAMQDLLKGGTDKVMQLVTVRQLTGIVRQLKQQYYGQSQKGSSETDDYGYPDW